MLPPVVVDVEGLVVEVVVGGPREERSSNALGVFCSGCGEKGYVRFYGHGCTRSKNNQRPCSLSLTHIKDRHSHTHTHTFKCPDISAASAAVRPSSSRATTSSPAARRRRSCFGWVGKEEKKG